MKAYYHLPGLFEFYELYKFFLPLFYEHKEYFYEWCDIGSIYGSPTDCLWGGGRMESAEVSAEDVLSLMREYKISARLTFSNSLLTKQHLSDKRCNRLCELLNADGKVENGVIIYSDMLLEYIKEHYPRLYFVSSTTKVIVDFQELCNEINRPDFRYVVPDFRLNKAFSGLNSLTREQKDKVEFLCNECCYFGCKDRKACYESVSRRILDRNIHEFECRAPEADEGYVFSKAMKNPGFISTEDIYEVYMPMGFSDFKIEGRSLGSALILEFLLYYMTKPEYRLQVREKIYLSNTLDLF